MATYLITQATGQQSQAVITQLLKTGAKIHAVVRDATKELPSALKQPNVTIFQGDSADHASILKAAQGCQGVFLNTFPIPGIETQQAKTIVAASREAGIDTVVASTTAFVGDKALWDDEETKKAGLHGYFRSKFEVEDIVRTGGFKTYTILRPCFIHFDYFNPSAGYNYPELGAEGRLEHLFDETSGFTHIDADDIGKYAAEAFQNPAKFGQAEIELSNEFLTIKDIRDTIAKVSGRDIGLKRIAPEDAEAGIEKVFARRFHVWSNTKTWKYREAGTKAKETEEKYGIPFTSLEETFEREKGRLLETLGA